MATFPPSVSQQPPDQGGQPQQGTVSPQIKLAMLNQAIQGLAQRFPNGQAGIQMMLKGLQMVMASASAASAPQQPAAPPR